jgi:serine/threonine protein kinase
MECPDANALQELLSGQLSANERSELAKHLDGCAECRTLVAALAREATGVAEPGSGRRGVAVQRDPSGAARAALEDTLAPSEALGMAATVDSSSAGPVAATPGVLRAGQKLGRYEVSARLGAGAMGVVYSALDPELGREVAIKVLRRPDPLLRDRLSREARAMAQVNHPNVVAVYDVGTVDDQVYVEMELVRGQSLRQWQAARRRSVSEIVEIYVGAGRGLAAAHAAGVVHRDFKPDNVLIGEDGRPRVTDFGLAGSLARAAAPLDPAPRARGAGGPAAASSSGAAALRASSSLEVSLTQTGVLLGTPVYMSPEQFEGGNVDPRSDQWAFCVSLFEALFERRPFSGSTWDELAQQVTTASISPGRGNSDTSRASPALRRIVRRGLSLRPGDRHVTMQALLAELGRDRGTPWRRAALGCAVVATIFAAGLLADSLVRQRAEEATTQTFRATGGQLERSVALRYESFVALADASYSVPVMHTVLGHKDQADFGFGEQSSDTENLALVHDNLTSADWIAWAQRSSRATIAVGDYKGRLLFTSADPQRWGADLLVLSAAAKAFDAVRAHPGDGDARRSGGAMVARYDDPRVMDAELFGSSPPAGLAVLFARALVVGGVPLGLFVQAIDGTQLLDDVSVGADVLLSLVAPDGSAVGAAPRSATRALTRLPSPSPSAPASGASPAPSSAVGDIAEARDHGKLFLVQARPLLSLDGKGTIATLVLAREVDPGLSGLFAHARTVFGAAAALLLAMAVVTGWRARALSLLRRW